ncbi:hypothetical protein [Streptomyces melanogenes]|uniref:hypothetical protein n=1 Tax=Streptomyces melanogenes TaxID=67326 RepID=UPI00379C1D80
MPPVRLSYGEPKYWQVDFLIGQVAPARPDNMIPVPPDHRVQSTTALLHAAPGPGETNLAVRRAAQEADQVREEADCLGEQGALGPDQEEGNQAWAKKLSDEDRRGLTALFWSNINSYGTFRLEMNKRLDLSGVTIPGQRAAVSERTEADPAARRAE